MITSENDTEANGCQSIKKEEEKVNLNGDISHYETGSSDVQENGEDTPKGK